MPSCRMASIEMLCGRPHNISCVAKPVMWHRPERLPVPSNRAQVERHITYRITASEGSPSAPRLPSTASRSPGHRPRSWPTLWLSSPDRLPRTRSSSPARRAQPRPDRVDVTVTSVTTKLWLRRRTARFAGSLPSPARGKRGVYREWTLKKWSRGHTEAKSMKHNRLSMVTQVVTWETVVQKESPHEPTPPRATTNPGGTSWQLLWYWATYWLNRGSGGSR